MDPEVTEASIADKLHFSNKKWYIYIYIYLYNKYTAFVNFEDIHSYKKEGTVENSNTTIKVIFIFLNFTPYVYRYT